MNNVNFFNISPNQDNCQYALKCREHLHCREYLLSSLQDSLVIVSLVMSIISFVMLSRFMYKLDNGSKSIMIIYFLNFMMLFSFCMIHAAVFNQMYILSIIMVAMFMFVVTIVEYFMRYNKEKIEVE